MMFEKVLVWSNVTTLARTLRIQIAAPSFKNTFKLTRCSLDSDWLSTRYVKMGQKWVSSSSPAMGQIRDLFSTFCLRKSPGIVPLGANMEHFDTTQDIPGLTKYKVMQCVWRTCKGHHCVGVNEGNKTGALTWAINRTADILMTQAKNDTVKNGTQSRETGSPGHGKWWWWGIRFPDNGEIPVLSGR